MTKNRGARKGEKSKVCDIDVRAEVGHLDEKPTSFRYRIGSLPVFLADQGDIVYVPKQTWHLASHGPTPMSTRLAMNGYQDLLHNWEPTEEQTRR